MSIFSSFADHFTAGLKANLPNAPSATDELPALPRFYYATDTQGLYVFAPNAANWTLLFQTLPVTVANLPTGSTVVAGTEAVVSDATSPTLGATVAGSGAVQVAVIYSGAAWKVA